MRFANLAGKPLWLDEIVTALFASGRGYGAVPVGVAIAPAQLPDFFAVQPTTCAAIAQLLATQSTHPPLFFCLMHGWLSALAPLNLPLAWVLRSLPALFGVGAIAAMYWLNRTAFSPQTGLLGAALMAVSPFGVYLSQEARQYSLLVLVLALALNCAVALARRSRVWIWVAWGALNAFGCYLHYFFLLVFTAQLLVLGWVFRKQPRRWWALVGGALGIATSYLPWLPIATRHFSSNKVDWLPDPAGAAPLVQLLVGSLSMAIALPVEKQPGWLQAIAGTILLAFALWLGWHVGRGLRVLWQAQRQSLVILGGTLAVVLVEFLGLIFVLQKDISVAPRYNYAFFPMAIGLLAASIWAARAAGKQPVRVWIAIAAGLAGSFCVIGSLAFMKPYLPGFAAERFNRSPQPVLIAVGYSDSLNLALGLSYALELSKSRPLLEPAYFVFLDRSSGYGRVWQDLANVAIAADDLWMVGPGLRRRSFPDSLQLGDRACQRDPENYYRIGIPYQRYDCRLPRAVDGADIGNVLKLAASSR
ncbi:glycosyltransferase family 39 protein [Rubidibacter lacunae]|uniref:glycosyltransferase family 39 protein n=1 Tax=Rubidibacter lacunae TaxID=582514 RepID=UPI001E41F0DA|nr:glycosyltransferase family 39 protein [Rubidibacter lacunae]